MIIVPSRESFRMLARPIGIPECPFAVSVNRFASSLPILSDLILNILLIRAQPQMRWIHARRVVAGMADAQAIRNSSFVETKTNSVRGLSATPVEVKSPISVIIFYARPFPAIIWSIFYKFLFPVAQSLGGENKDLAIFCAIVSRIFSGGHKQSVTFVRAFGLLDTTPTLAPI